MTVWGTRWAGRPKNVGRLEAQIGSDVRQSSDDRIAKRDRTSVTYQMSGEKMELWVLSKSFTRSIDPLLIVRDPYTQEQTINEVNILYLHS